MSFLNNLAQPRFGDLRVVATFKCQEGFSLVNVYIAMENHIFFMGKSTINGPFSTANCQFSGRLITVKKAWLGLIIVQDLQLSPFAGVVLYTILTHTQNHHCLMQKKLILFLAGLVRHSQISARFLHSTSTSPIYHVVTLSNLVAPWPLIQLPPFTTGLGPLGPKSSKGMPSFTFKQAPFSKCAMLASNCWEFVIVRFGHRKNQHIPMRFSSWGLLHWDNTNLGQIQGQIPLDFLANTWERKSPGELTKGYSKISRSPKDQVRIPGGAVPILSAIEWIYIHAECRHTYVCMYSYIYFFK